MWLLWPENLDVFTVMLQTHLCFHCSICWLFPQLKMFSHHNFKQLNLVPSDVLSEYAVFWICSGSQFTRMQDKQHIFNLWQTGIINCLAFLLVPKLVAIIMTNCWFWIRVFVCVVLTWHYLKALMIQSTALHMLPSVWANNHHWGVWWLDLFDETHLLSISVDR